MIIGRNITLPASVSFLGKTRWAVSAHTRHCYSSEHSARLADAKPHRCLVELHKVNLVTPQKRLVIKLPTASNNEEEEGRP
jgi:hypothetical protein